MPAALGAAILVGLSVAQLGCSCDSISATPDAGTELDQTDPLAAPMAQLQSDSAKPTSFQLENGALVAAVGSWKTTGAERVERAQKFVEARRPLFGLDAHSTLSVRRSAELPLPDGTSAERVTLYQQYQGIPVEGGSINVLLQGEDVIGVFGHMLNSPEDLDTTPAIAGDAAVALARPTLSNPDVQLWAEPALVAYEAQLFSPELPSAPTLAWRLALGEEQIFVDANTGQVIAAHSNVPQDLDVEVYHHGSGQTVSTSDCQGPSQCSSEIYQLLHNFAVTYVWYRSNLNWVSYDNADSSMEAELMYEVDGYATSNVDHFKFTYDSQVLDIVGHEFTHSVISATSNLVYKDQPGAINESFADLFGDLVQGDLPGGDVGEGSGKGILRNMCSPATHGQPARFQDYVHKAGDNGGVHTNSGIGNRAWCSLVERYMALGMTAAQARAHVARVAFVSMVLLTETASYAQLRGAVAGAAATLAVPVGGVEGGLCAFIDAFEEVGLTGGGNAAEKLCHKPNADRDGDGVPDSVDNCPDTPNPNQKNLDKDAFGDSCDQDWDNDGILNKNDLCSLIYDPTNAEQYPGQGKACYADKDQDGLVNIKDNCPKHYNPDQKDTDKDGRGDICDPDTDKDGVDDDKDNCPYTANPDQKDTDKDALGDACDKCPIDADQFSGWTNGNPSKGIAPKPIVPDADLDGVPDVCDPTPHGLADATGVLGAGGGLVEVSSSSSTDVPIFFPLIPCLLGTCPTAWDEGQFVVLQLTNLTSGAEAVVVDDHGVPVARTNSRGTGTMQFRPRGGVKYRLYLIPPPGGAQVRATVEPATGPKVPTNPVDACAAVAQGGSCRLAGALGVCTNGRCGPPPAGADAGLDAGPNASQDAGPDASQDAGPDAGGPPAYSSCTTPVGLSDGGNAAVEPDVAIDGLGNAVAAWREYTNASKYFIKAARYTPAGGWSAPILIAEARPQALSPRVAVNASGDAAVYWLEQIAPNTFYVSHWNAAAGAFDAPINILSAANYASYGSLALDDAGNAWALFLQSPVGSGVNALWAARYLKGIGWQAPGRIDPASYVTYSCGTPVLALNGAGRGVIAWVEISASPSNIWARFIAADGTLSTTVAAESQSVTCTEPFAAINGAGTGVVGWRQFTSGATLGTWDLGAALFSAGAIQTTGPIQLASDGSTATAPTAAVDPAGNVAVTWRR